MVDLSQKTGERRSWAGLALVLAVAGLLRFYSLDRQPFWCDEYYTWRWVSQPSLLSNILHILVADIYPPFYQIVTWTTIQIDDSPFWLRFWSALGGTAAAGLCWVMVRQRFSASAALAAGLLAAFSPLGIYYSQEAKFYSFFAALGLWMLHEFLRVIEEPQRSRRWLALAVALCAYTSFLTPYLVAPLVLACALLAWTGQRQGALRALQAGAIGYLASLPMLPFFFKTMASFQQGSAEPHGMWILPWYSAQNFSLGFWAPESLASAAAALCLLGVLCLWRLRREPKAWVLGVMVLFALLPPLLNWLSSMKRPVYADRAILASAYAWLMVAALGTFALPRSARLALLGCLLGLQAGALLRYYDPARPTRVDYLLAYQALKEQWQPGEAVFHNNIQALYPFKYYAYRESLAMPNWVKNEVPALAPQAEGYRAIWRKMKGWFAEHGLPIDGGMEASRVWGERMDAALKGVSRLWYVNVDDDTLNQTFAPQLNLARTGFRHPFETREPVQLEWLKERGFRFRSQQALSPGIQAHLFERRTP